MEANTESIGFGKTRLAGVLESDQIIRGGFRFCFIRRERGRLIC